MLWSLLLLGRSRLLLSLARIVPLDDFVELATV